MKTITKEINLLDIEDVEEDAEYELLYDVFDGLYFEFPTPFEKGDILCEYEFGDKSDGFCRGPFVICRLPAERILTEFYVKKT